MVKERVAWLDRLRGMGMLLVIIGHIPLDNIGAKELTKFIYAFHIPLFFMISGMAYWTSSRIDSPVVFIKKKVIKLVIPYFLWQFILIPYWYLYIRVLLKRDVSIWEPIKGIFYGNYVKYSVPSNAMWFLLALFWVSIAVYFIEKIKSERIQIIIIFALVCMTWFAPKYNTVRLPWQLTSVPAAIVFYWMGFVFMKYLYKIKNLFCKICNTPDKYVIFVLTCIFISNYMIKKNGSISMGRVVYGNPVYFYIAAILMIAVFVSISMWMPRLNMLNFIGTNTLTLVAIHCPILRLMQYLSPLSGRLTKEHPFVTFTIIMMICIPICIFVNKKAPILNGKKSNKKWSERI